MRKIYSLILATVVALAGNAGNVTIQKDIRNASPVKFEVTSSSFTTNSQRNIDKSLVKNAEVAEIVTPAAIPAKVDTDESGWTSLGMCRYTDDFASTFFNVGNQTYEVEIQESDATPGLYRLVNPYGAAFPFNEEGDYDTTTDHYMIIHAENPEKVYIEEFYSGMDWGYGEFIMFSVAGQKIAAGTNSRLIPASDYGTLADNVITFPEKKLLVAMADFNGGGYYYANTSTKFQIALPGAKDYSIDVTAPSCAADNKVPVTITAGADVASIAFVILNGGVGITVSNAEYLLKNAETFGVGTITAGRRTLNINGADGKVTIFAMSLDAEGNLKEIAGCYTFAVYDEPENWTSLGTGSFTDDFLASFYTKIDPETMNVEIQENIEEAGLYRIVNPYATHPYAVINQHDSEHNHYIYVKIYDGNYVSLLESPMGVNLYGDELVAYSMAQNYLDAEKTIEEVVELGSVGTYNPATRTITFPEKSLLIGFNMSSSLYYANTNNAFELVIPEPTAINGINNDVNNSPVEYFNLQGMRITNPTEGQVVIVRQGSKVAKTLVK